MPATFPRPAYIGRFAPSPTGPLHAGSLVAALASWLDARAHGGSWLVRIEDIDPPRCQPGADQEILRQLAACGLHSDGPVVWQSQRHALYAQALERLVQAQWAYPCGCTRKDIEAAWQAMGLAHERHVERPYPGTCRSGLHGKPARAWRFALQPWITKYPPNHAQVPVETAHTAIKIDTEAPIGLVHWQDRRLGALQQDVLAAVGDFVLRRADGLWAYQLAVVVDDDDQGITDIVRGEDLADNTPRQIVLQQALHLPRPRYLHTPLVRMANGEKLSKQHGAPAVDLTNPVAALTQAAACLGLPAPGPGPFASNLSDTLAFWVRHWQETYPH